MSQFSVVVHYSQGGAKGIAAENLPRCPQPSLLLQGQQGSYFPKDPALPSLNVLFQHLTLHHQRALFHSPTRPGAFPGTGTVSPPSDE